MKTLSIKLPIKVAQAMDDRGHLNPIYISTFIYNHLYDNFVAEAEGLKFTYVFKVADHLHARVKAAAAMNDLPISDFICQMFYMYYDTQD